MRALLSLILAASLGLFAGFANAQEEAPAEGAVIKGSLVVGRSTFALPPGDWIVAATLWDAVGTGGSMDLPGAKVHLSYLVQLDADGNFVAAMFHYVPLAGSKMQMPWARDRLCGRSDTLFRDVYKGTTSQQECLVINHLAPIFAVGSRSGSIDRKFEDWLQQKKVKLPAAALAGFYRNYIEDEFVNVSIFVNPELLGQEKAAPSKWTDSVWHPKQIGNDKVRLAFVENFKKLSYQMADNARATMKDRKPTSTSLPALEDLRVK